MALTKVQVISNALTILGKKPIMSLVNQGDMVTAAEQAFDFLLPVRLSEGFWRFATKILPLSQSTQTPIGGYWKYTYVLPGDYLKLVHLWPQIYNYEMYTGGLMYSNYNNSGQPLFIEYVFMPTIAEFPSYFWGYFVYELAMYMALSNAQSVQYYDALAPARDMEMARAMAADAQNRPQTPLQSKPMISRRYVSTFSSG